MSKEFIVTSNDEGKRIDQFLANNFSDLSRNKLSKMVKTGEITCNRGMVKPSHNLKEEDVISVGEIKKDQANSVPKGEKIDLEIIFEDDDAIVINKPAGLVVHPADGNESGTLVNALINYYPKIVDAIYDQHSEVSKIRPGIVHRLDKDSSGVMIVAKNKSALDFLSGEIRARNVEKRYRAICLDNLPNKSGELINKLIRHPQKRKEMAISEDDRGKEAITKYKVISSHKFNDQNISLIEFQIITGRTHQIRVHAKSLNSPVLGDKVYNIKASDALSNELNINRPLLHSRLLKIKLPNGETKEFIAKVPDDFKKVLDKF